MKRICGWAFLSVLFPAVFAGCVTGKVLNFPGGLTRPAGTGGAAPAAVPTVAVLDFAWNAPASQEIGRDYFSVRPIVWKGAPGKAMADLVAAALNEKGIPAVRAAAEAGVPADVPVRLSGTLEEFRVDAKKIDVLRVEEAAYVVLTVSAAAPGAPAPWTTHLSADYWDQEALFVTPEGVRDAMNGAANAAADEAARRLIASGILPAPAPGESATPGQEEGMR
ncbi:MAG: hypothetical protein M1550_07420 [Deltaproteobacteria bacterium]|nr:hypothetical protein [Deltaproteobacteria bacterium]